MSVRAGNNMVLVPKQQLSMLGDENPFLSGPAKETNDKLRDSYSAITGKQIILGTPPSKSNRLKIITLWNKDKTNKHGSLAKSSQTKQYERDFAAQCRIKNSNIDYEFKIDIDVYFPNRRSDIDNPVKVILDCLQQCNVIKNDNLCVDLHVKKYIDPANPRIEFSITKAI